MMFFKSSRFRLSKNIFHIKALVVLVQTQELLEARLLNMVTGHGRLSSELHPGFHIAVVL
jgi:hypothetical protein